MVQVENEIGMLPVAREWGPEANAAWAGPVPAELLQRRSRMAARRSSPSCAPCGRRTARGPPGPGPRCSATPTPARRCSPPGLTPRYTDAVTRAGKAAYPLADVRQRRPEPRGQGAGRISQRRAAAAPDRRWKTGAPSLDLISPDIYFPNFNDLAGRQQAPGQFAVHPRGQQCRRARDAGQRLLRDRQAGRVRLLAVPGRERRAQGAGSRDPGLWRAQATDPGDPGGPGPGQDRPASQAARAARTALCWTSRSARRSATTGSRSPSPTRGRPGRPADRQPRRDDHPDRSGRVPDGRTRPGGHLAGAGDGASKTGAIAGIDSAVEGVFDAQGRWVPGRTLNGDQTHQGRHIRLAPDQFQHPAGEALPLPLIRPRTEPTVEGPPLPKAGQE